MSKLKIDFCDFWQGFNKTDNWFFNLIKEDYDIEISDNPDFVFYSIFGNSHKSYNCIKIFFSGENIGPNFNECDYSMCFDWIDDERHYRLPLYVLYDGYYDLVNKKVSDNLFERNFCNFIVSNSGNSLRNNFFLKLNKYKKVDSGGRVYNNIGRLVDNKLEFQKNYKFSITFENNAYRNGRLGYTTEKIMDAMRANTIPIYWGNDWIEKDFNKKSFVNFYDFKNEDQMIEYIIYLDKNKDEYIKVLREPWFVNNEIPETNKKENIKDFLYKIFKNR